MPLDNGWRVDLGVGFGSIGPVSGHHDLRMADREQTSQALEPSSRLRRFQRIHFDAFPSGPQAAPPRGLYQAVPAYSFGQSSERTGCQDSTLGRSWTKTALEFHY